MKAKGRFISTLLIIDTFLVSYYFGMHDSFAMSSLLKVDGRPYLVIDPSLPPVQAPEVKPALGDAAKSSAGKLDADKKNSGKKDADKAGAEKKSADKRSSDKKDAGKKNADHKGTDKKSDNKKTAKGSKNGDTENGGKTYSKMNAQGGSQKSDDKPAKPDLNGKKNDTPAAKKDEKKPDAKKTSAAKKNEGVKEAAAGKDKTKGN